MFRERISAKPGETIRIAPDPKLVHLFDQRDAAEGSSVTPTARAERAAAANWNPPGNIPNIGRTRI